MLLEQQVELLGYFAGLLSPPPQISVSKWGEKNVIIPQGRESYSGPVDFTDAPYAREPLDCYADRSVRHLINVWATQCLKTTVLRVGAMYRLVNDPLPCMWVLPNEQKVALPFAKNRWMPLLEACGLTNALIPRTKNGKFDRTNYGHLEQTFSNGVPFNFVGSNSPANLSSRPVGLLQMDELDKFALETDFEPGALDNAEERCKNYAFALIVKASSPTVANHVIWREFLQSDQRYFYIPCPRCEQLIVFRFNEKTAAHGDCGLRWYDEKEEETRHADGSWDLAAVAQAAHYKCQRCGRKVYEGERANMIKSELAQWKPHAPDARPEYRGYHLSSLYSLISPLCTFPKIAVAWCASRGDLGKRHRFINSTLAEPWNVGRAFDENAIATEDATAWVVPADGIMRLGTIDFQFHKSEFWVVIRDWAPISPERPKGESWLQVATRLDTIEEVEALMEEHKVPPENVFMDISGRPNEAGRHILRNGWRGLAGSDSKAFPHRMSNGLRIERIYSEVLLRDAHAGTRNQDRIIPFSYRKWAKDPVRDLVTGLRFAQPSIWHITSTVHPEYQRHLNAHVKMVRVNPRTNEPESFWKELHGDDHLWDDECMQGAIAVQRGYAVLDGVAEQTELKI